MCHQHRWFVALLAAVLLSLQPVSSAGQEPAGASWTQPRTLWGDPDLQGVWDNATITPLERPTELCDRETLTDEERAALNEESATRADRTPRQGSTGTYNAFWFDRGQSLERKSLIVAPPTGRLPALTDAAERKFATSTAARGRNRVDSWEDRSLRERCIIYHPVPGLPTAYNNNYQIFQSPDYVAILTEEIHETRIIPLDGRPHIPGDIRLWFGDSRGRWEGDSLVVETTNLMDHYDFVLTNGLILQDENARIVERFTRVGPDTIEYQFTVHDPTTYTSPWTAVIPMQRNPGLLYEYACHEGNYSLTHMLGGARADERARSESR